MGNFTIDIKGLDALRGRLRDMPATLARVVDKELEDGCQSIVAEAKQRAPVDQGILVNEIGFQKVNDLAYAVYSNALYSAYVEFGTRANVSIPPGLEEFASQFIGSPGASSLSAKEAIFAWCKRMGIDPKAWYAIYITLMVSGVKPHPFFFPAVNRILPIMINRITKTLVQEAFK